MHPSAIRGSARSSYATPQLPSCNFAISSSAISFPAGAPQLVLVCRSISNTKSIADSTRSGFRRNPTSDTRGFIFAQLSARLDCDAVGTAEPLDAPHAFSRCSRRLERFHHDPVALRHRDLPPERIHPQHQFR